MSRRNSAKEKSKSGRNQLSRRNNERAPPRRNRNDNYDSFDSFDEFDDFGPEGFGSCGMGNMNFGMGGMDFGMGNVFASKPNCGWTLTSSDDSDSSCTCSDCRESAEATVVRNAQRPKKRRENILSDYGECDGGVSGRIQRTRASSSDSSNCSCSSCERGRRAKARARQEKRYKADAAKAAEKAKEKKETEKAAAKDRQKSPNSAVKIEKGASKEAIALPASSKPHKHKRHTSRQN